MENNQPIPKNPIRRSLRLNDKDIVEEVLEIVATDVDTGNEVVIKREVKQTQLTPAMYEETLVKRIEADNTSLQAIRAFKLEVESRAQLKPQEGTEVK